MKSVLTILTAFVLLSSSFTFSSCKSCDEKETKPAGRDSTPSDTTTSNATPDGGSSTTLASNDTLDGSNTNGASDGNNKTTDASSSTSGDNTTGLGSSGGATGAGGKSDGIGVPALISLEDKIKAVKELVLKVRAMKDRADAVRGEIGIARLGGG